MLLLFFSLWAFGAVLLLTCTALVWSERISILHTLPICAKCGYSLVGLSRTARCPECGDVWRKFTTGNGADVPASESVMLWITPTVAGLIASGAVTVVGQIGTPDNVFGTIGNAIPFVLTGVLLRVLLRWITLGAARTMMWCSIAVLTLTLFGLMADANLTTDFASTPLETYRLAPLMVLPFAGYGLAGGILVLTWARSRPVRVPRQVRSRTAD